MAIKLDPNHVRAYNNRGFLYAKLNYYEEAIKDYTKAIELDPTNSHAYHNRGISYDKMGMIDLAIADFSKVRDISLFLCSLIEKIDWLLF
jgi:tetratricopeptide (TPR) repeat protein